MSNSRTTFTLDVVSGAIRMLIATVGEVEKFVTEFLLLTDTLLERIEDKNLPKRYLLKLLTRWHVVFATIYLETKTLETGAVIIPLHERYFNKYQQNIRENDAEALETYKIFIYFTLCSVEGIQYEHNVSEQL